jgi:uncharacterized membrane protein
MSPTHGFVFKREICFNKKKNKERVDLVDELKSKDGSVPLEIFANWKQHTITQFSSF